MSKPAFKEIPIQAAKSIAKRYGFNQVVIIARCLGDFGGEHVTTYGVDRDNCSAAARIGAYLKYKIMQWPHDEPDDCPHCKGTGKAGGA